MAIPQAPTAPSKKTKVSWNSAQDNTLMVTKGEQKSLRLQSESGWKKTVSFIVVKAVNTEHPVDLPKEPDHCKSHFGRECTVLTLC